MINYLFARPIFLEPLKVEKVKISITGLTKELEGITITHLSDFHFDNLRLSQKLLDEAIERNNKIQPDLVFLTGDFITDDIQMIYELAPVLAKLNSKFGIYAVLGNHDSNTKENCMIIINSLQKFNINVLWDQIAYPLGKNLPIVGLKDLWTKPLRAKSILSNIPENIPRIVLAHNPDTAAAIIHERVDLQLSGHTHGGQIVFPYYGSLPEIIPKIRLFVPKFLDYYVAKLEKKYGYVVKHWEWSSGLHIIGKNKLYVNRGLGTYFPGRVFCPPELTVIVLKKK